MGGTLRLVVDEFFPNNSSFLISRRFLSEAGYEPIAGPRIYPQIFFLYLYPLGWPQKSMGKENNYLTI